MKGKPILAISVGPKQDSDDDESEGMSDKERDAALLDVAKELRAAKSDKAYRDALKAFVELACG